MMSMRTIFTIFEAFFTFLGFSVLSQEHQCIVFEIEIQKQGTPSSSFNVYHYMKESSTFRPNCFGAIGCFIFAVLAIGCFHISSFSPCFDFSNVFMNNDSIIFH